MRIRIALLVLLLATLAAGTYALSQRPHSLYARFSSAENLTVGAPIRAQGLVVGKLAGVERAPDGTALAEFAIDRAATVTIPADSVALLAPGGIDLLLGDSPDPAGPDTRLKGYHSLTELRLDSARGTVDRLLDKMQIDAQKLGRTLEEKGAAAGEFLRQELERLRKELEKALPEKAEEDPQGKSI